MGATSIDLVNFGKIMSIYSHFDQTLNSETIRGCVLFYKLADSDPKQCSVQLDVSMLMGQSLVPLFFRREPSKLSIDLISLALFHWTNYGSYVN